MDYIDRKETIKAVARLVKNGGEEYLDALCAAEEVIKGMPSEDVAEVKHAKWIRRDNPLYSPFDCSEEYTYICSHCFNEEEHKRKCCPYCGARMDGEENE